MFFVIRQIHPPGKSARADEADTVSLITEDVVNGDYLEWSDPNARFGLGDDRWTPDLAKAKRFETFVAASECWRAQSTLIPIHAAKYWRARLVSATSSMGKSRAGRASYVRRRAGVNALGGMNNRRGRDAATEPRGLSQPLIDRCCHVLDGLGCRRPIGRAAGKIGHPCEITAAIFGRQRPDPDLVIAAHCLLAFRTRSTNFRI